MKDINIPGTHDSGTKFCQLSLFSSCQNKSISEQLKIGVRVFDIRVGGMTIVHSFCESRISRSGAPLRLENVIGDMFSFLTENPSETIVMLFKMDKGENSAECLDFLYENFIKENRDKWFLENRIPNLGEVRGKIVLVRRTDTNLEKSGLDFTCMPDHRGMKETKAEDFSPNGVDYVTVQDRYSLTRKKKWEKSLKPLLEESEKHKNNLILNYFSTAGIPVIPRFNASYINRQFLKFKLKKQNHYGIQMFDFVNEELTKKVIDSN